MTENHGVPGSNPGPATYKSPANRRKTIEIRRCCRGPFSEACQQPDREKVSSRAVVAVSRMTSVAWMQMARVILLRE